MTWFIMACTGQVFPGRYPDLLLANYREALGDKISSLDAEAISNKHGLIAEFDNDASSKKKWSIKKALIGSVEVDGGLYAISMKVTGLDWIISLSRILMPLLAGLKRIGM